MSNEGIEILPYSSSLSSDEWKYDVFLSFRGEDTRRNFTDHLYAALVRQGIYAFRDDKKLERGESIAPEISKAIQESKSSLIVFSRNYASSTWCLDELVQIVECKHRRGQHMIFPIFYDVDPSAVRRQTGSFKQAFDMHERAFWWDKSRLQKWRSALVEVANISGWNAKDRHESELIEEVVRKIAVKLRPIPSNYNSVLELTEIDRCLETLKSYVASTIFLHTKYEFKDQAGSSAGEAHSAQQRASCSSEEANDSIKQQYQAVEEHVRRLKNSLLEKFTLQLLLRATRHFSESFILGRGCSGSVYRGILEDSSDVAIKRLSIQCKYKDDAFLQELELLSRLNHKNIVRLWGFHIDHAERILVFEYLEHGSLHNHLFTLDNSPLNSSWAARLRSALDIARGLEYLHEYAVPPIIHRDVKPFNILFDSNWTAKIADFGLALVAPKGGVSDCEVCGTPGYLDPEYYRLKRVTMESDVYSFGVVLLQLLSGHKAFCIPDEDPKPRDVVDFVVPGIVEGRIEEVLDQRVIPPTPFEIEALRSVGDLAVDCVNPQGRFRPSMSEIVNCLLNISNAIVAVLPS